MYPPKIPYGQSGCNLYVGAIIWPPNIIGLNLEPPVDLYRPETNLRGVEIKLMNVIAERLNLVPHYYVYGIEENWGNIYSFELATGIFGALADWEIDVAIGTITLTESRYKFTDSSIQYLQVFAYPDHQSNVQSNADQMTKIYKFVVGKEYMGRTESTANGTLDGYIQYIRCFNQLLNCHSKCCVSFNCLHVFQAE